MTTKDLDARRADRLAEVAAQRADDAALDGPLVAAMQERLAVASQAIADVRDMAAKLIYPITSDNFPLAPQVQNLAITAVNVKNILTTLAADTAPKG